MQLLPMRFYSITMAIVALSWAAVGQDVASKEPIRLKPTTKWSVDHAPDYCRLMRSFGSADDRVTIVIDRFGPSVTFRFTLIGKTMAETNRRMKATVAFGVEEKPEQVDFLSGTMNEVPAWLFQYSLYLASTDPATSLDEIAITESKINQIFIGSPLPNHVVLETGSLAPPFKALRECTEGLLVDWGLDVERHSRIKRWASSTNDPATWMSPSDYPKDMLRDGQQAIVEFRLIVGADGASESCSITISTHPKFNDAVCKAILKRAKLSPAIDREQQPMRSFYFSRVIFRLDLDRCETDRNSAYCAKK